MKTISTLIVFLITISNTIAQSKMNFFTGKITGQQFEQNSKIIINIYDINQIRLDDTPTQSYTAKITEQGDFKLTFIAPGKIFYMDFLAFCGETELPLRKEFLLNPYLSELGDSIHLAINLKVKTAIFKGKGADKLNCQYLLNRFHEPTENNGPYYFSSRVFGQEQDIPSWAKVYDLHKQYREAIIDTYSNIIPDSILNQIKLNMLALMKFQFLHKLLIKQRFGGIIWNEKFNKYLAAQHSAESLISKNEDLANARAYPDFLLRYDELFYRAKTADNINSKEYFNWMFNNIKTNYSGLLRERLLITWLVSTSKNFINYQMEILPEAISLMKDENNKQYLLQYQMKQSKGTEAYPFTFEDIDGKKHSLIDYKDKILVMDFWFTGCHGCMEIPPVMKVIMEEFKQRKDVIFLSISIDASKRIWLSGLKSKKYTLPGQVHLKTIGYGKTDPFITNYGIISYPQILLIGKEGKLLSANPKDIRLDNGAEVIKMIKEAN